MTIAAILQRKGGDVVAVTSTTTIGATVSLLAERGIGAVVVRDGDKVLGIFSERDLVQHLGARDGRDLDAPVASVMSSPAVTAAPDDSPLGALAVMTHRRIRHLPVVKDGALIGIVSIGDLVKFRIDSIEADAAAMRDYIRSA